MRDINVDRPDDRRPALRVDQSLGRLAPLGARQNRCTGKPALMPGADTAAPSVRLGNDDFWENLWFPKNRVS